MRRRAERSAKYFPPRRWNLRSPLILAWQWHCGGGRMQPLHLAIVGPVVFKAERLGQIPGSRLEQSTMDGGRGGRALRGELPHSRGSSGAERLRPRPAWTKPRRQMGTDWAGSSREITTSDGQTDGARSRRSRLARSLVSPFFPPSPPSSRLDSRASSSSTSPARPTFPVITASPDAAHEKEDRAHAGKTFYKEANPLACLCVHVSLSLRHWRHCQARS